MLAASLIILAGCAGTESGPMATARKIHSMTPCGMMMESMMGNGHSGHSPNEAHNEVESNIHSPSEEHHLHSQSEALEQ